MYFVYQILDWFFTIFHTLLIIFNLTGWMWRCTRKWNLLTLLATAGSWIFLGFFYGFGYCPFTDWHFSILYELGERGLPASYVQYLIKRVLNVPVSASLADAITVAGLVLALIISVYMNVKDRQSSKAGSPDHIHLGK